MCQSPSQIAFVPNKPLSQNTEYQISFNVKKLYDVPKKELELFNFTVKTLEQAFRVKSGDLQSYNKNLYFLNAELLANDQISYETVKDVLKANLNGKKVAVKFQSQGTNNKFVIIFDSKPICAAAMQAMPKIKTCLSLLRVSPMMMRGIIITSPVMVEGR